MSTNIEKLMQKIGASLPRDMEAVRFSDGRHQIKGLRLGTHTKGKISLGPTMVAEVLSEVRDIEGATIKDLALDQCSIESLRFQRCALSNITAARCDLRDTRIWSSSLHKCAFEAVDFRQSSISAAEPGEARELRNVTFSRCDFRDAVFCGAAIEQCVFDACRMKNVSFESCDFQDCQFVGSLEDAEFYGRESAIPSLQTNDLAGVDFSRAVLRYVNFHKINFVSDKTFPRDGQHLAIYDYPETLRMGAAYLRGKRAKYAHVLVGMIEHLLEHAGPSQSVGVVHIEEFIESANSEVVHDLMGFWGGRAKLLR